MRHNLTWGTSALCGLQGLKVGEGVGSMGRGQNCSWSVRVSLVSSHELSPPLWENLYAGYMQRLLGTRSTLRLRGAIVVCKLHVGIEGRKASSWYQDTKTG